MMKEMSVKDVQNVCLEVLEEFHRFCVDHKLRYSLEGGTLLGAIRHKGYIPWDNDVDVMMPRPDYNRFVTLYKDNENFACFADERKNCYIAYARLADIKKTIVKPASIWTKSQTGVWIDIFPVDGVESDKDLFVNTTKRIFSIWRKVCLSREAMGDFTYCPTFIKKLKLIAKKMIYRQTVYRFLYEHLSICHRYEYDSSAFVSIVAYSGDSKLFFPRNMMDEYVEVPFEHTYLSSIKNYEQYLRSEFGNYMQLPPVDQQFVHDMHRYFWKN